jgi:hypothetical protein
MTVGPWKIPNVRDVLAVVRGSFDDLHAGRYLASLLRVFDDFSLVHLHEIQQSGVRVRVVEDEADESPTVGTSNVPSSRSWMNDMTRC